MKKKTIWIVSGVLVLVLLLGFCYYLGNGSNNALADDVAAEAVSNPEMITIDNGLTEATIGQEVEYQITVNLSELEAAMNLDKNKIDLAKKAIFGASSVSTTILDEMRNKIKNGNLYLAGYLGNVAAKEDGSKIDKTGQKLNARLWVNDGIENMDKVTFTAKVAIPKFNSDGSKYLYSKVGLYYRGTSKVMNTPVLGKIISGTTKLSTLFGASAQKVKITPLVVAENSVKIAKASYSVADLSLKVIDPKTKLSLGSSWPKVMNDFKLTSVVSDNADAIIPLQVANKGTDTATDVEIILSSEANGAKVFEFVPNDNLTITKKCGQGDQASICATTAIAKVGTLENGKYKTVPVPIKYVQNTDVKKTAVQAMVSMNNDTITDPSSKNNSQSIAVYNVGK